LLFKAFVARIRGQHGAAGNLYASVYLWFDAEATAAFVMGERFQSVIDSFGRPRIETWLTLDLRLGPARHALSLYREESLIDAAADRPAVLASETERNREIAAQDDTLAVWIVLEIDSWRLTRFTLSAEAPDSGRAGTVYDVLYLAKPGLGRLA